MMVVAQRVVSQQGVQGVNAFLYLHDQFPVTGVRYGELLDQAPGTLVDKCIVVPPPGNRVRSYLDVLIRNEATPEDVSVAVELFVKRVYEAKRDDRMPWMIEGTDGAIRFLCDEEIQPVWEREIRVLLGAGIALLSQS